MVSLDELYSVLNMKPMLSVALPLMYRRALFSAKSLTDRVVPPSPSSIRRSRCSRKLVRMPPPTETSPPSACETGSAASPRPAAV
jgi:hypothetical protein